jgi:hypothetical protein
MFEGYVMELIEYMARQLLREMGYQAEGKPTPDVVPSEAAQKLDIDPTSPEYGAALDRLLFSGDIEPNADPTLLREGLYRLTRPGLVRAREIRWR